MFYILFISLHRQVKMVFNSRRYNKGIIGMVHCGMRKQRLLSWRRQYSLCLEVMRVDGGQRHRPQSYNGS
jgi:hypothetical protein